MFTRTWLRLAIKAVHNIAFQTMTKSPITRCVLLTLSEIKWFLVEQVQTFRPLFTEFSDAQVEQITPKKVWYLFWLTEEFLWFCLNRAEAAKNALKNAEIPYTVRIFVWYLFQWRDTYCEAKKDIMASNPRNLTISGVFLAFPRFFATMRFADTECRKKDIISKKRLRTGFEPCSTHF